MSEAEKAMDILSEVTQKIISETKKREQQNKDIQNNTPEMKWDFEHASIVKMKNRDEFLITKDNEVVSDYNPEIEGENEEEKEDSRKSFIKSLDKGEILELNGIEIKENEIDDDIEQKIKDHYKPIEEVEQEKHREETETIIDKLQDKTQIIDYAKQYEHYTDADYKEDVELEVEEHLSETANDLSEDATYYNSDIDSVHTNNELMDNKLKEEEIKIRNTADKRVQEKKDLVKNLPDLTKEQQSLVQELQNKMRSLNKEDEVYQDAKQILDQTNNEHTHDQSKKNEINLEKEIENHSKELNDFINDEVINEKENTTNLTKEEVEGMLNDHFKRVEELLDQHNENDIDADTFKSKLNDLTKHIKTAAKQKFKSIKHSTTKPVKDLKTYAKNRINKFMNQFNEKLKNASHNIDKKFNDEHEVTSKSEHSKQKIEQTLKENPSLFKEVALMSQLHEIDKHLDKSNQKLDQLNQLEFNDPAEQQKLEETKGKLNSHVNTMHNEKEKLEQHVNKEQTLESFNEQVKDNKQEKSKAKENTAEMTR